MPLFDTYVMVDWSASKSVSLKPKRDAIWWASVHRSSDGGGSLSETLVKYEPTRTEAISSIIRFVAREMAGRRRVLVGFDFAFGYPKGIAKRATGSSSATRLWSWMVDKNYESPYDAAEEINGLYAGMGPFYSQIKAASTEDVPHASQRRWSFSEDVLRERRVTEEHAMRDKLKTDWPKTVWQLNGQGAVGAQSLVGIPDLHRLRKGMSEVGLSSVVWPFHTGLRMDERKNRCRQPAVFVEIYPSLLRREIAGNRFSGEILDRAQVRMNALAFAQLDDNERLAPLFSPFVSDRERRVVEDEEGWILGVGQAECVEDGNRAVFEQELRDALRMLFLEK